MKYEIISGCIVKESKENILAQIERKERKLALPFIQN